MSSHPDTSGLEHGSRHSSDEHDTTGRTRTGRRVDRGADVRTKPAKTSAAATFSLVFGVSAVLSVLTLVLAPLALVLGLIGIVLGVVGLKMTRRVGVTGKGLAIGGLVLSVLAVLLAATAAIGITTFLNDDRAVAKMEQRVEQLRDQLPSDVEIPQP
jgi:hypothetical protein